MKKIKQKGKQIIFAVAILILLGNAAFADIFIHREGGGKKGYSLVSDNTDANGNRRILCSGPGELACPMMISNTGDELPNVIISINNRIIVGDKTGRLETEHYKAIWQSNNLDNSVIIIKNK